MPKSYILTLDGGGMRGIFAARLLQLMASEFTLPQFRLIAGTSTGAILAAACALRLDIGRLLALYMGAGASVFKKRPFLGPRILEQALHSPYQHLRLRAILRQVFGRHRLRDVCLPLIIPATDLETSEPFIFSSFDSVNSRAFLYDALTASCCAPGLFDPFVYHERLLADGALHANNPSLTAIATAVRICNVQLAELRVLSIGCGHFQQCYDRRAKNWGLATGWKAKTLAEFSASLNSEAIYRQVSQLLTADHLLRLNFSCNGMIAADDFSFSALLLELAQQCFLANYQHIASFLEP